ncbi:MULTISPECIES: DUF485 domain-containing protein [unclassified Streptomyces]|uniref:DUF485 domain-containing protein n=1 Tax=unclassified Streptomyces TaxID=2593676 RepID=UPI00070F3733|nr:DUF485 domain-containing protein [Streptomyces sp. Root1310]KQX77208.1 hypothetical protein ASD48_37900 [Streptomyces sp. Root1310]
MTYPDDRRYPQPEWQQPWTEPYGRAPRYASYGRDPGQEPSPSGYDDSPYERYGQAAPQEPYAHERHPHNADLAALRSAYRVLRRVSTFTALGSFVVYVVLSCYARGLMGARITGELSLGMALGILQLVVTFAAVFSYGRSARRSVDPLAQAVRDRAAARPAGVVR